jgi:hypothetical protein
MDFDIIIQLLIRYSAFVSHWRNLEDEDVGGRIMLRR